MAIILDPDKPWWDIGYWAGQLMEKGTRMWENWVGLSTEEIPEDAAGKIDYGIRLITQVGVSKLMEGAGMAAFLLEEAVQAIGMGAFLLYQSKDYKTLDTYMDSYDTILSGAEAGIVGLATINPLLGGAVMTYLNAAREGYDGLRAAVDFKLADEENRTAYIDAMMDPTTGWGTLRLKSSPSLAEIWMNGENTELLTPETFKELTVGTYDIEVRRYSTKREVWDIYAFEITMAPGRTKEVHVRIPPKITDEETDPGAKDEDDVDKVLKWIKAEVEGEYAIDGDTFITSAGERIRILGIDAPEIGRPWADIAKEYLSSLVEDKNISLRIQSHKVLDAHGRTLAICKMYKGDIAELLLSAGLARLMVFPDDLYDPTRYETAENNAKTRRIGIWGELP